MIRILRRAWHEDTWLDSLFDMLYVTIFTAVAFNAGGQGEWAEAGFFGGLVLYYLLKHVLPGVRVTVTAPEGSAIQVVHGKDARVNSDGREVR